MKPVGNTKDALAPAVSAYISHRGAEVVLEFNFRGPFKFPVEGYMPYASDV